MNPGKPSTQEPKILYETVARSSSPGYPGVNLVGHVQNSTKKLLNIYSGVS